MKGCFFSVIFLACALIVIFVTIISQSEKEVRKYNGIVMIYKPSYEQYVCRVTGLDNRIDAHEITPEAAVVGPIYKAVVFSLNKYEATKVTNRLKLRYKGICKLSNWTNLIDYEKCRYNLDKFVEEWDQYEVQIKTSELESIIGKIENEGSIEHYDGYKIIFLFNENANKGIIMIYILRTL